jgi:antitoxin component YwqK of YwqJK toxin-antitoxin module
MRTYLIATVLILLFLTGCTNKEVKYWDNGNMKSELTYRGELLDGTAVWYHINGNKRLECIYDDNLLDGEYYEWYFNGNIKTKKFYSKGKISGIVTEWDKDGNKLVEMNYVNDTLDGSYNVWHPNGQIKIKGSYLMGLYDGEWTFYDESGIKVGEGSFSKGNGKHIAFYLNGNPRREINYRENVKHGKEIRWDEKGMIIEEIEYVDGVVIMEKTLPQNSQ